MTIQEMVNQLSREERFMGTVHAMNTLLMEKGIYTPPEFDAVFMAWGQTQLKKNVIERPGCQSPDI